MRSAQPLSIATLLLFAAVPVAWFACGGESKPAASPAEETASSTASAEPAASDSAAAASASAAEAAPAPASTPEPAASAPPPPPSFANTDCGKCVDKTCAKQATACGKDNDCQAALDSIHNCSSGPSCVDSATPPSAAKAKKLATAYETCGKKAVAKACKAKCQ